MKKLMFVIVILAILTLCVSASFSDDSLNNTTDLTKAISDAQTQNKSVMIVFDQKSCVYCDMLKEDVLANESVKKQLDEDYIVVIVDINEQPDVATKYNIYGTPTVVILDSSSKEVSRIDGYVEADEFLKELSEV